MDPITEIIGRLVLYGGGGIAIGFGMFRFLGEKWIDNRFAQKLKQLEHEKNVVVARLIRKRLESHMTAAKEKAST